MKRVIALLAVIFVVSMYGGAFAKVVKAKYAVELSDPVGDVKDQGDDPGKDVVKVRIKSDGTYIHITAVLHKDAVYYLDKHKAGAILSVSVDTDNNTATGGTPFWSKMKGYDYLVEVNGCIDYGDGIACAGSMSMKSKGFFAAYDLRRYEQGSTSGKSIVSSLHSSRQPIKGKEASISLPYKELGVAPGQVVRMAIREEDSSYDEKSFFPEVLLTLK